MTSTRTSLPNQLAAVLSTYRVRPMVWVMLGLYVLIWGFVWLDLQGTVTRRETHLMRRPSRIVASDFEFESWERLSEAALSTGERPIADLFEGRISPQSTRFDLSKLLATPDQRSKIVGSTDWPEEGTAGAAKLIAYCERLFDAISLQPRVIAIALPPLRLTGEFARVLRRLPQVETLLLSGCTIEPDGWEGLAHFQNLKELHLNSCHLATGLAALGTHTGPSMILLDRCREKVPRVLEELRQLQRLNQITVGPLTFGEDVLADEERWQAASPKDRTVFVPEATLQSQFSLGFLDRLSQLPTPARIVFLPPDQPQRSIREDRAYHRLMAIDRRFELGFADDIPLGAVLQGAGSGLILLFLLGAHLTSVFATPIGWLAPGQARTHLLIAAAAWVGQMALSAGYGWVNWASPLAVIAIQIALFGVVTVFYLLTYAHETLGASTCLGLWGAAVGMFSQVAGWAILMPFLGLSTGIYATFPGWVPAVPHFLAGEYVPLSLLLGVTGLALSTVAVRQFPKVPAFLHEIGAEESPLSASLAGIQAANQIRRRHMKASALDQGWGLVGVSASQVKGIMPSSLLLGSRQSVVRMWRLPMVLRPQSLVVLTVMIGLLMGGVRVAAETWMGRVFDLHSVLLMIAVTSAGFSWMWPGALIALWVSRADYAGWELSTPITRHLLAVRYSRATFQEFSVMFVWQLVFLAVAVAVVTLAPETNRSQTAGVALRLMVYAAAAMIFSWSLLQYLIVCPAAWLRRLVPGAIMVGGLPIIGMFNVIQGISQKAFEPGAIDLLVLSVLIAGSALSIWAANRTWARREFA